MKKIYKLLFTLSIFASLFLAGCKDPVFYYIENDVSSEEATVNGVIRSIARYTTSNNDEYIVTVGSNGFIYKRVYDADADVKWVKNTQKHGTWTYVGANQLPFELHRYNYVNKTHVGQQIIKIVSDSNCLYVFTVSYEDTDEGKSTPNMIYVYSISPDDSDGDGKWDTLAAADWTTIVGKENYKDYFEYAIVDDNDYKTTKFNAFSTNAPVKAHRSAYVRVGDKNPENKDVQYKYYELSKSGLTPKTLGTPLTSSKDATAVAVNSAVYFAGKVNFLTTSAVTTDESLDNPDPKVLYWGDGKYFRYTKDLSSIPTLEEDTNKVDAKYKISSMAHCGDTVLLGLGEERSGLTSLGGVEKVDIDSTGTPAKELGNFTTNAQTQLLSSYMLSIVFNTNPADNELDSSLYAGLYFMGSSASSSVSFANEGLWSYYPARGNWNRE